MPTSFANIHIDQMKPYTLPNANVLITFNLLGEWPDIVQVWAQEAGSQPANIIYAVLVDTIDWQPPNPEGNSVIQLQAGNAFSIFLAPRTETNGDPDPYYDNIPWFYSAIYAGSIVTKVPPTGDPQPTKPVIVKIDNEPAGLTFGGTITVSWISSSYDIFIIAWTWNGQLLASGEVDQGGTSGSWTANQPIESGATYTFSVEGATYAGVGAPYNKSGFGPTVTVKAAANLRSLVTFLEHSGIDPAGLSVKSIMGGQTSLKSVMKLQ